MSMGITYDETELFDRLATLGRAEKTAFAAACAQRLFPLYERYSEEAGRGDSASLEEALAAVWRTAVGESDESLMKHDELAESLVPDDEDDDWIWASGYAQNAAASVAYAARTWLEDDPQQAVWAARQLFDAADYGARRAIAPPGPDSAEPAVLENSLVQASIEAIEADLLLMQREGRMAIPVLRERARREGSSTAAELP